MRKGLKDIFYNLNIKKQNAKNTKKSYLAFSYSPKKILLVFKIMLKCSLGNKQFSNKVFFEGAPPVNG